MSKIPNIFLIGPMGSGKSTIGRHLARKLQMDFYDSDKEVEQRTGVSIPWIFDVEGETGFRKREEKIIDELTQKNSVIIATGGGAILNPDNRKILASRGIAIYLKVSISEQMNRTQRGHNRPLLEKKDLQRSLEVLNLTREPFYSEIADFILDTNKRSIPAVVSEIIDRLHSKQES